MSFARGDTVVAGVIAAYTNTRVWHWISDISVSISVFISVPGFIMLTTKSIALMPPKWPILCREGR